jgi:hypothetical protein
MDGLEKSRFFERYPIRTSKLTNSQYSFLALKLQAFLAKYSPVRSRCAGIDGNTPIMAHYERPSPPLVATGRDLITNAVGGRRDPVSH